MSRNMVQEAEQIIGTIDLRAQNLTLAVRAERHLRENRDALLDRMVNQLIGQPNPLTEKPHSATSAEKAVKDTDDYSLANEQVLEAECERIVALADYERALLSAKLAVAALSLDPILDESAVSLDMPVRVDPMNRG